jgi:hypothetical protein
MTGNVESRFDGVTSPLTTLSLPRPDAIPSLISALRSSVQSGANRLQLPRTLLILLQIIKELSTARLQRTRASLQSVAPEIFQLLGGIYVEQVNNWGTSLERGNIDEGAMLELLEQSLMALKVLRRLIIAGFEHPHREKAVQGFWELTHAHFTKFYTLAEGAAGLSPQGKKLLEKHVLQLSKLHIEMANVHPASFALLPGSVSLVKSYWELVVKLGAIYENESPIQGGPSANGDTEEGKSLIDRIGLKALLLIRACAKMAFNPAQTFKYQQPQDKDEKKESIELIKSQLFTHDFVINVMELLVTRFFRFRKADFQEWEEEPEEWEKKEEEISSAWEFSIRSCAEKLFLDLVINFKELLIPRLLNVFYGFASKCRCLRSIS